MCCFSQEVRHVAKTRIFARATSAVDQAIVYAMRFEAAGDLAMVLPIPTPQGAAEDAVRFVDLSGYASYFDDLEAGFPIAGFGPSRAAAPQPASLLLVHRVGAFEASFVPSATDFERLDPRFRLPRAILSALPGHEGSGFAVFKLRGGASEQDVHPMAFTFPRRDPRAVFFPTLHVHDGRVHPSAEFDHELYVQSSLQLPQPWWSTMKPASRHVDLERARGLVDGDRALATLVIRGTHRNEDVWAAA